MKSFSKKNIRILFILLVSGGELYGHMNNREETIEVTECLSNEN